MATVGEMLWIVPWALFLLRKLWWEAEGVLPEAAEIQRTREGRELGKPNLLSLTLSEGS